MTLYSIISVLNVTMHLLLKVSSRLLHPEKILDPTFSHMATLLIVGSPDSITWAQIVQPDISDIKANWTLEGIVWAEATPRFDVASCAHERGLSTASTECESSFTKYP